MSIGGMWMHAQREGHTISYYPAAKPEVIHSAGGVLIRLFRKGSFDNRTPHYVCTCGRQWASVTDSPSPYNERKR